MIYSGSKLNEIAFPVGGLGSGCVSICGNGMLTDFEIFGRPNKGSINDYTFFALIADYKDGTRKIKILQGDMKKELSGRYSKVHHSFGYGVKSETMAAYPHFKDVIFDGRFPIATLIFKDPDFPGKVIMNAWSPFIPLDSDNSSLPCAFFDITIEDGDPYVDYSILFSIKNPFENTSNIDVSNDKYSAIKLFNFGKKDNEKDYGDITIGIDSKDCTIIENWYRGSGRDNITIFWRELEDNKVKNRKYLEPGSRDVATIITHVNPNEKRRFVLSWNVPNCYNYWDPYLDENGCDVLWKYYYATKFYDSVKSCFYSLDKYACLYNKTKGFRDALFSSSLEDYVLDAISSSLSVLKSSTVYRLENGEFYGFEGTFENIGSCEGTCTHVYSYAYALCFLFPNLERGLRETEFKYDLDKNTGRMNFRTKLPLGRREMRRPHCLDGQMLTVLKSYREWKICGDDNWLKDNWKNIKKALEYAWNENNYAKWDLNHDGVLEGQMHHTLDTDLFGPSSWLEGLYILALKAGSQMAKYLHEEDKANEYLSLYEEGYEYIKNNLFNGEYFIQKIDLNDKSYIEEFECPSYWYDEGEELKYQIGEGCEIDQMLAQWHSNIVGLGEIFDKNQMDISLKSIMKYNYKESLREYTNLWRVYALNDESGVIICEYPNGKIRPKIPVQYTQECMTGFEYALAGLLISEGFIHDGLKIVKFVRERYDGEKRNPWNEIECGGNYARCMSSYALLPIFSGFVFDMPNKKIGFSPILDGDCKFFWSLDGAYGLYERNGQDHILTIISGGIKLSTFTLGNISNVANVLCDDKPILFEQKGNDICFDEILIKKCLVVKSH